MSLGDASAARPDVLAACDALDSGIRAIAEALLGGIYFAEDDAPRAESCLRPLLACGVSRAEVVAHLYLGQILSDADPAQAEQLLRHAWTSAPDEAARLSAQVPLGSLLIEHGNAAEGQRMLLDVVSLNSALLSPGAAWQLATSLQVVHDLDGAESAYMLAIATDDTHWRPTSAIDLGIMLTDGPRWQEAVSLFQGVIRDYPSREESESDYCGRAALNLGRVLWNHRLIDEAENGWRIAAQSPDPGTRDVGTYSLAKLLEKERDEWATACLLFEGLSRSASGSLADRAAKSAAVLRQQMNGSSR